MLGAPAADWNLHPWPRLAPTSPHGCVCDCDCLPRCPTGLLELRCNRSDEINRPPARHLRHGPCRNGSHGRVLRLQAPARSAAAANGSPSARTSSPGRPSTCASGRPHTRGFRCAWTTATGRYAQKPNGYFSAEVPGHAGSRYGFLLGNDARVYPDPASRSQPQGLTACRRSSIPPPTRGTTRTGADSRGPDPVRVARRHLHAGGHLCGRRGHLDVSRARRDGHPDHAGRGIPGSSAGATTASACSRHRTSTAGLTTFASSSIGRTRPVSRVILDVVYNHVGPDGNYLAVFARTTSPTATRTNGVTR